METFDIVSLVHEGETVIYQPTKDTFVTTDGSFITLWVDNELNRCKFIHRFSQLDKDVQVAAAIDLLAAFVVDSCK